MIVKRLPLAIAATLAFSNTALAQGPVALEEIIVTATKKMQTVQDTPITLTAFGDQAIQEAGINDATDLSIMTPSLTTAVNVSPFTARFSVRGIGTAQTDPALEPSVGLFVDGIFIGRSGLGMSDLTDIERIEVLQGPQGTLYGKNTNAGAISVFTKGPNEDFFEGYVEASAGNYNLQKITAAATGPITDSVSYRLSATQHERDGFMENKAAGGEDLNDVDDWNVIGKLRFEINDELAVVLSGSHVERDNTCCAADAIQSDAVNDDTGERKNAAP